MDRSPIVHTLWVCSFSSRPFTLSLIADARGSIIKPVYTVQYIGVFTHAVNLRVPVYTLGSVLYFPAGSLGLGSEAHVTRPHLVFSFGGPLDLTPTS